MWLFVVGVKRSKVYVYRMDIKHTHTHTHDCLYVVMMMDGNADGASFDNTAKIPDILLCSCKN